MRLKEKEGAFIRINLLSMATTKPTRDLQLVHNDIMEIIYGDEHPVIAKVIDSALSAIAEKTGDTYTAPELITRLWCEYAHELRAFDKLYKFPSETRMAISYILNDSDNDCYYSAKFPKQINL